MLPAYAGMIPGDGVLDFNIPRAPRIRGDDPDLMARCARDMDVLPAYAGMIHR